MQLYYAQLNYVHAHIHISLPTQQYLSHYAVLYTTISPKTLVVCTAFQRAYLKVLDSNGTVLKCIFCWLKLEKWFAGCNPICLFRLWVVSLPMASL